MNQTEEERIKRIVEENRRRYKEEFPIWWNSSHRIVEEQCRHRDYPKVNLRIVDRTNGFEIEDVQCSNCKKSLELRIRAFKKPERPERPRRGF